MRVEALIGQGAEELQGALATVLPPALLPLPGISVKAEVWEEDRHLRLAGEAIYAVHRGDDVQWAVVVRESDSLEPGQVRMVGLNDLRCESASGRRSW